MNRKLFFLSLLLLLFLNLGNGKRSTKGKRQAPFSENQQISLVLLQALARQGGLPEKDWKDITKYDKDLCYTPACLETAVEIMKATNFTVDPCQPNRWRDFVCRRRTDGNVPHNDMARLTSTVHRQTVALLTQKDAPDSEFLFKEAQTLYSQCLRKGDNDAQDVKDILNHTFSTYGEWPMLTKKNPGATFDWMKMVADLNRVDKKDFTPALLRVSLESSAITLYLGEMIFPMSNQDFQEAMKRIRKNSGREKPTKFNFSASNKFLLGAHKATSGFGASDSEYTTHSIHELQEITNQKLEEKGLNPGVVNWEAFFQRTFSGSQYKSALTPETPVVLDLDTIMILVEYIARAYKKGETKLLADALHFQLTTVLLQETTELLDNLSSFTPKDGSRESVCYERITEVFGFSLGRTYLNTYYNDLRTTPAIEKMTELIRKGYIARVNDISWMKQPTKDFLVDKIQRMKALVVQPDWMKRRNGLQNFYKGLHASTDSSSSYPLNYLNVTNWAATKKLEYEVIGVIKAKRNETEDGFDIRWSMFLGMMNALYTYGVNQIVIFGGMSQPPMFDVDRPGFNNFGGLGMVVGHEIGHSFDQKGRVWNARGQKGEFWDAVSKAKYNEFVNHVQTQYTNLAAQGNDVDYTSGDAYLTMDENIADILGVGMAFQAYKLYLDELNKEGKTELKLPGLKNFSPEKLFFMKYANAWCELKDPNQNQEFHEIHSPGNVRATMPLKFSKSFAETFGCKLPDHLF